MGRAALLSVSDRAGILEFARGLAKQGFTIVATGGTCRLIREAGIAVVAVEEYTGHPEILDGRVKTLHPRIHAGILARRDDPAHLREVHGREILLFDVVAVNLYPFVARVRGGESGNPPAMIEQIDIGGPSMLRAAAKNFHTVYAVVDPTDYHRVLAALEEETHQESSPRARALRKDLAVKVLATLAADNLEVARYLESVSVSEGILTRSGEGDPCACAVQGEILIKRQPLRYGENPHQHAGFFVPWEKRNAELPWQQLGGKELSYNNLLDLDATRRLLAHVTSDEPTVVIVKHCNPCGVARGGSLIEALQKAKRCDPRSHFGGILGFSHPVGEEEARDIREDFCEIVVAPDFTPQALSVLQSSKSLRILKSGLLAVGGIELRSIDGGVLMQQGDTLPVDLGSAKIATGRAPSSRERSDLDLAWRVCAQVRSNAITLVNDGMLIGVGAGQMSRIDSVELALAKARTHGHEISGAVAASDAFFPFPDNIIALGAAGIRAVVAPGGAKRDQEIISAAEEAGVALLLVGERHFRH